MSIQAMFAQQLTELVAIPALSGLEDALISHMAQACQASGAQVQIDALGNVMARYGKPADAQAPLVLCAHLDSVGLLVKQVLSEDSLGVVSVGGINLKALPATQVLIHTTPPRLGVVGVRSQHLSTPANDGTPSMEQIYIHTQSAGQVSVGTPVSYAPQITHMGALFSAPYLDNRVGCALLLALGTSLGEQQADLPRPVVLVGTVQEETTCYGAQVALAHLMPAGAVFVDGTLSYDTPDTRGRGAVRLGAGAVLNHFLYVSGLNAWHAHPKLTQHLLQLGAEQNLALQQDAVHGLMSDARSALPVGIPSALLGIPLRGKHSPQEQCHLSDLEGAFSLLKALCHAPLPDLRRGQTGIF